MTSGTWLVIFGLIALNALYVSAEFGAVGVRRSRIRQLAEQGNRLAIALLPAVEDAHLLDRYVAACQIGITLSSLALGAYGQAALTPALARALAGPAPPVTALPLAAAIVLVGLAALQVVLGELVPKSAALQFPVQAALYTHVFMRASLFVFGRAIRFLNGSANLFLRLFGIRPVGHRHIHSPEEIDLLIADSRRGGMLEPEEEQRLHRAIRLGSRRVHQLMVPRPYVQAIPVDTPAPEVLRIMAGSSYTRLPVYEGDIDHPIGLLHVKDVLQAYVRRGADINLRDLLRPLPAVPEVATADRLIATFQNRRTHQAIVTDEYGGVAGLVTLEDVLAEVIGEAPDEFKRRQPRPERLPDGRVRLPGLMRVDEAEPWVGVHWEAEADTVGGLVLDALGHEPAAGERVEIQGVPVEVEAVAHHAVVSVLVVPQPVAPEEEPA